MTANYLSTAWTSIAPALGNHLWQSTFVAIIAGSLTLALRRNQARTRYWLWMAASIKFLIPFSLLMSLGAHLARPRTTPGIQSVLYVAMEQVGQPFTPSAMPPTVPAASSSGHLNLASLLP